MFNTDRLLRWRLILESYGTDIEYIEVNKNILADALSRLRITGNQNTTYNSTYKSKLCQKSTTTKNYLKLFSL